MPNLKTSVYITPTSTPLPTPLSNLPGLPRGALTEIYGTSASGKTQLLLTLAVHALPIGNVLLLDAEGGIEPSRVVQIHQSCHESHTSQKVRLIRLHTFHDLAVLLHTLPHLISATGGVALIGVDSITSLFRTLKAADSGKRLEAVAWRLREIAINYNCAVVVSNHARSESGAIISAMGDSWRHVCGTRLCTKFVSGERVVTVVKSPVARGDVTVDIAESGVVES